MDGLVHAERRLVREYLPRGDGAILMELTFGWRTKCTLGDLFSLTGTINPLAYPFPKPDILSNLATAISLILVISGLARDMQRLPSMNSLRRAARALRQSPGFTVTAVVVLSLGIGMSTAIFSVVDGAVLHSLAFPHPQRLVHVSEHLGTFGEISTAYANFLDWAVKPRAFPPHSSGVLTASH